jgi:hypothetical protein
MPNLTPQQTDFVLHYTSTPEAIGNAAAAARLAGYSEPYARELGRQLLDKPHVRAAVDEANRQAVSGRLATKAVALLERVIEDESAPVKVRVDAAKAVLDRAGWPAGRPTNEDNPRGFLRAGGNAGDPDETAALSGRLAALLATMGVRMPAEVVEPESEPTPLLDALVEEAGR